MLSVLNFLKVILSVGTIGIFFYVYNKQHRWVPVVLWHGMGDSCCNPLSLGRIKKLIQNEIGPDSSGKNVYIYSIKIGENFVEDTLNGYFKNINEQVENACNQIKNDPMLSDGYNAIGFSQGSQFLRALAQRCPTPKMFNLISVGGQHQGVYGLPHCSYPDHKWCDYLRRLLDKAAYITSVQNHLVQAEYWHDPLNEDEYKSKSIFLADINNERNINEDYITNLQNLKNLVFIMFNNDTMVMPKESSWFGFYTPGQAVKITSLWSSKLYVEDRLGLKKMNDDGKLHFFGVNGDHLQLDWNWFCDKIINPYLRVPL